MSKFRKAILIIGILVVMAVASLGTAFALLATNTIKTDPIELIYAVRDEEKIYDGTPLTATDYVLNGGELLPGHTARVEILGSQTNVGVSQSDLSVKIFDGNGYNVTSEYIVKVVPGDLTVTKKAVKISMPSQQVVYNGSKVLFEEYEVPDPEFGLVNGHKIYGSTEAKLINVGDTLPRDLQPLVFDVAGNEVTDNYEIEFTIGDIEVIPRPISVRPVSCQKVYDGTPMIAEEYEFIEGSLVEGQWAEYKINKNLNVQLVNVGELELELTAFRIYDTVNGEKTEVTLNYSISTYETGLLKITPRDLTVTAPSQTWLYDGEAHSIVNGDDVTVEGLAERDHVLSVTVSGSITDVGTARSYVTASNITLDCLQSNYNFKFVDGTLKVTPYELTIITGSDTWYYQDKDFSKESVKIVTPYGVDELANEGHRLTIMTGMEYPVIHDVGSIENEYKCRIYAPGDVTVTDNYKITYVYGTLTVNKMPVTVTLDSQEYIYNGEVREPNLGDMMTLESVDGSALGIGASDFEPVITTMQMKDAGEYSFSVKFRDKNNYNNYVLDVVNNGFIKIKQKKLTVEIESATRDYDGTPLFNGSFKLYELVGEEGEEQPQLFTYYEGQTGEVATVLPSVTVVGSVTNEFRIVIIDENDGDVTKNYLLSYKSGKLEVTPRTVKIQLNDFMDYVFNNTVQTVDINKAMLFLGGSGVVSEDGKELRATEGGEPILTVGDFTVFYDEEIFHANGRDASARDYYYRYGVQIVDKSIARNFNLQFTCADMSEQRGYVRVAKLGVKVTLKDISVTYNGKGHSLDVNNVIYSIEDTSKGLSRADFTVKFTSTDYDNEMEGKQPTDVNSYTYTVALDAEKLRDYDLEITNFDGRKSSGSLTINKYRITITSATASFVYNGTLQGSTEFTNTPLANDGHKIFVDNANVNDIKRTTVGSVDNALTYSIWTVKGADESKDVEVTANYDIVKVVGTITVTKRPITLTTPTETFVYDGTEQASSGKVTANEGALCEGHEVTYKPSDLPTIKDVGEKTNFFACTIVDEEITENYEISYNPGRLVVTKRSVTFITNSQSKYYDTVAVVGGEITVSSGSLGVGHSVKIAVAGNAPKLENVGKISNQFEFVIEDGEGNDVRSNYDYDVIWGVLELKPRKVGVTLVDYTYGDAIDYDGKVHVIDVTDAVDSLSYYGDTVGVDDYLDTALKRELSSQVTECIGYYGKINYFGRTVQNAGSYEYTLELSDNLFTGNFVLIIRNRAKITVNPANITLRLEHFTETYNGTEFVIHAQDAVNIIYDENDLLKPSDFSVYVDGGKTVRDAGHYTYSVYFTDSTYAKNFNVTGANGGSVDIDKLLVQLYLKTYDFTYCGEEITIDAADAVTVLNTTLLGSKNFLIDMQGQTVKDHDTYTYTVEFADDSYNDNFRFEPVNGIITVNKLNVTVYLNNFEYVFANTTFELNPAEAVVTDSHLLTGGMFTLNSVGVKPLHDAGEYAYTAEITDGSVADNFNLVGVGGKSTVDGSTVEGGKVTIKKLDYNVTLQNLKHTYNGVEYNLAANKNKAIISTTATELVSLDNLSLDYDGARALTIGDYMYRVSLTSPYAASINFTYNRAIVTVEKCEITVNTGSANEIYGTAAQCGEPTIVSGTTAFRVTPIGATPKQEDVGSTENVYEVQVLNAGMTTVTENFKINYIYGKLTVTARHITVTTGSVEKVYDGAEASSFVANTTGLEGMAGYTLSLADGAKLPVLTDVGVRDNVFTCKVMHDGADVSKNFVITYVYGTLKITPRKVTVTITDTERDYSGDVIMLDKEAVITNIQEDGGESLLKKEDFIIEYPTAIKNAGLYSFNVKLNPQYANNFDVTIKNDKGMASDGFGYVTVNKLKLSVSLNNKVKTSVPYNGRVQTIPLSGMDNGAMYYSVNYQVIGNPDPGELDGSLFTFIYSDTMLNAGIYQYTIVFKSSVWEQNYEIAENAEGNFQILRVKVDVDFGGLELTYNGKNQASALKNGLIITGEGAPYLTANDLAVTCNEVMIDAKDYTCTVSFVSEETAGNFTVTYAGEETQTGFSVSIAKRKVALTLSSIVYIPFEKWDEMGGAYSVYDISAFLSLDANLPLAEGDYFSITGENLGTGQGDGTILILAGSVKCSFKHANGDDASDNYEIINASEQLSALISVLPRVD